MGLSVYKAPAVLIKQAVRVRSKSPIHEESAALGPTRDREVIEGVC